MGLWRVDGIKGCRFVRGMMSPQGKFSVQGRGVGDAGGGEGLIIVHSGLGWVGRAALGLG